MKSQTPPSPAVQRLSLYLRQLEDMAGLGIQKTSSRQLAEALKLDSAQVRKDFAYFGQFGRPGVGYRVEPLIEALRRILGTDRTWKVVVIGAGDLGRALLRYKGFLSKGFELVAAFDISSTKVGKKVGTAEVYPLEQIEQIIATHSVKLAVVAVPTESAQQVTDRLCAAGVMGILNFAPVILDVPDGVTVAPVDLAAKLEQLSFRVAGAQHKSASSNRSQSRGKS